MLCVKSYADLREQDIRCREQHWCYVILFNLRELTPAGRILINNLDYFDLDSGKNVVYFIPGFLNNPYGGLISGILGHFGYPDTVNVRNYGSVHFYFSEFINCVHELEKNNNIRWRYSGECELLLINLKEDRSLILNDFYAYNMDDIVRNGRSISSFIRATINVGKDSIDKRTAKRKIDSIYAEMILPAMESSEPKLHCTGSVFLEKINLFKKNYYFISYSSKDYRKVNEIRELIEKAGVQCWMAPRDIPYGTNYAHMIEISIKNAEKFILMLSESAVWSVWVEKELQRAIHYFQHNAANKIIAAWVDEPIVLDDTPMGYTLEGVQLAGRLSKTAEYIKLLPQKTQERLSLIEKLEKTAACFDDNLVTVNWIKTRFEMLLGVSNSMLRHIENIKNDDICAARAKLKELNERLKADLKKMKKFETVKTRLFISSFEDSAETCDEIKEVISTILQIIKQIG